MSELWAEREWHCDTCECVWTEDVEPECCPVCGQVEGITEV